MAPGGATSGASAAVGAYGIRLTNIERARRLLTPASTSWPHLEVRRRLGGGETSDEWVSETQARLRLQTGGEIELDRARERVTFVLPRRVRSAELVHPLLAPVGSVMAYWLSRECFHAGAILHGGRAWGILGARGAGKSTAVAALALAGVQVLSDDLLVVADGIGFAGPRAVDLRRDAAERFGVGEYLGVVGARERWRFSVGDVPPEVPLAGWVFLEWGKRLKAVPVAGAERLVRLHASRGINLPPRDPERLLELAALPAWELRRPKGWRLVDDVLEALLDRLG